MTERGTVAATVEARMTSTRLPGKVLMSCQGKTMLEHMIDRVRQAKCLDKIIIATTVNDTDDVVEQQAQKSGVCCYRGSEDNVMLRVLEAAKENDVDIIVELTGDCPMLDPALIDTAVKEYLDSGVDYVSNMAMEDYEAGRAHPLGFSVQVFSTDVLADAYSRTDDPLDHEHVSRYIYQHQDRYSVKYLPTEKHHLGPGMSVTLDTPEDFEVICAVLDYFYPEKPDFTIADVVKFLSDHPKIRELNQTIKRVKV